VVGGGKPEKTVVGAISVASVNFSSFFSLSVGFISLFQNKS